ncbi:hypothetical protein CLU79DRAFT_767892 [Phycomyces nitens]|nr:hypothetical protein CLU79DRAFT_767892 [Phycomyces nitens]
MAGQIAGYDAIPSNDPASPEANEQTPLNWWNRVRPSRKLSCGRIGYILLALTAIAFTISALLANFLPSSSPSSVPTSRLESPVKPGISQEALQAGLDRCNALQQPRKIHKPDTNRSNPRVPKGTKPVLLRNAVVWDGQGGVQEGVDVYLKDGVIKGVGHDLKIDSDTKPIDVGGRIVGPGLVDMHTHLGVDSWPELAGTQDTNEMSEPMTPFVRSLDAFNPSDNGIKVVASGGVTSVLVLPGSGNIAGGEAYAFKLREVPTTSNEDMLIQAGEPKEGQWRWMKMACGENPKRVYGNRGMAPMTRMGEAYLLRESLEKAQKLKQDQEDWCNAAQSVSSHGGRLESRFPIDIKLESLVSLLRGDVLLNIHCYETHDIEAMIRHSLEFNFTISAFHHALDAYRVPEIIKRAANNITVATFSDHWGYKKEAFQASPRAPKILFDAGIPVAFKSDHPVLNSQHLMFEAAKGAHYGLPAQEAFKSVTSVPANAMGLGHRIGSLKVGYDADVVVWDRSPLALGATPIQVFVDGVALFDAPALEEGALKAKKETPEQTPFKTLKKENVVEAAGAKNFVLRNVGRVWRENELTDASEVVVTDGKIVCVGNDCTSSLKSMSTQDYHTIDLQGGYVLPGLVAVGSSLGLVEIPAESSTGDGVAKASSSQDPKTVLEAFDGLKFGTRHLEEAYKGGVLTTITAPMSQNVVVGVSVAFKTNADSMLSEGAIIAHAVALHLQIGDSVKSSVFPTVSSQISYIRKLFAENGKSDNYYGKAARGEIPLIVSVNNKDEIASLIQLKKHHLSSAKMSIMGGAEAHLIAPYLAAADIAVILRPGLCTPESFDSIHCLTGAPLTNGTAAHVLHQHGVKIGLGVLDNGLARNLAWDAGWLSVTSDESYGLISETQAVEFITTNLWDIFGLRQDNLFANDFVVWSASPFAMNTRPVFSYSQQEGIQTI